MLHHLPVKAVYVGISLTFLFILLFQIEIRRRNQVIVDIFIDKIITQNGQLSFEQTACHLFMFQANCDEKLAKSNGSHVIGQQLLTYTLDFRRVFLITTFNRPNYESAPRVYNLYSQVFGKIFFCAPEEDNFEENFNFIYKNNTGDNSNMPGDAFFIGYGSFDHEKPVLTAWYQCLPKIIEKFPHFEFSYDGAIFMGDDVIFNFWNSKLKFMKNLKQPWLVDVPNPFDSEPMLPFEVDNLNECSGKSGNNEIDCVKEHEWPWPRDGPQALHGFYEALQFLANNFDDSYWKGVQVNLTRALGGPRRMIGSMADLVYIPSPLFQRINPIFQLFYR